MSPRRPPAPSGSPPVVPLFLVAFAALGLVLAAAGSGERAAAFAMTGFGVWGLCLWGALDAGSPLGRAARPWAAIAGGVVAVVTALVMARPGNSTNLSPEVARGLAVAFGAALGIAAIVIAARLFRERDRS